MHASTRLMLLRGTAGQGLGVARSLIVSPTRTSTAAPGPLLLPPGSCHRRNLCSRTQAVSPAASRGSSQSASGVGISAPEASDAAEAPTTDLIDAKDPGQQQHQRQRQRDERDGGASLAGYQGNITPLPMSEPHGAPPSLVARLREEQHQHSPQPIASRKSSSSRGGGAAGVVNGRTSVKHPLSAPEMERASRLAAVNDYVYTVGPDDLEAKLSAAGLTLLAQGHNQYTRWFVAQGRLPRVSASRTGDPLREEHRRRRRDITGEHSLIRAELEPELDDSSWPVERLVFVRGVMWRDSNVSLSTLWQELANAWPEPFSVPDTGGSEVVVHRGVARIAKAVWEQVLPWILDVSDGTPLTFAGHSLGGAVALILTAKARSRLRIPAASLSCHAFGSPGVMGTSRGGGGGSHLPEQQQKGGGGGGAPGDRVCRILGLDPSSIRWFCLDDDPVPRAMLAVDPVYSMLKQTELGAQVLGWRQSMDADGPLTLERCLYEPVGRHFLLRWDSASRTRLVEVSAGPCCGSSEVLRLEEAMRVEVQAMIEDPMRLLKAMADHRQSSYVSELMMAAQDIRGDEG